jgi:hypothetical protein
MSVSTGLSILGLIKFILPDGSTEPNEWNAACDWPPDLFAAVAALAERSGLYSEAGWAAGFEIDDNWVSDTRRIGGLWADQVTPPQEVEELWSELITDYGEESLYSRSPESLKWKSIALRLLSIADEACAGIGFAPGRPLESESPIQYLVYEEFYNLAAHRVGSAASLEKLLPYLPYSLCVRVPPSIACVQPKASTPAVGCTLRSLTHHLALLPSVANVATTWQPAASKPGKPREPFNILIVPFPFHVPGTSFTPASDPERRNERPFTLKPSAWMGKATAKDFADFLIKLIREAKGELEPVHAIVMPETALPTTFANQVAAILAKRTSLELLITGVVADRENELRNMAAMYRFLDQSVASATFQSKHHRWILSGDQVRRYHLGHVLDPNCKWWEKIDVSYRACYVMTFRAQATLAVLVCEDLARYDPVLTVMNAIGPNLVVALLMDGPQLEQRWSGRYATALAEDPGSAVLTVTSLGMVLRSSMPGDTENREIALWKQPNGQARPLKLPKGDHALLVTLTSRLVEQYTLDGRGDGGSTVQFELGAARPVRYPHRLPRWLVFKG